MPILQGEVDLLLEFCKKLVVAVDHVSIASTLLDKVGDLRRRHASPEQVSVSRTWLNGTLPMLVCPACVILDRDLRCKAQLPLLDLHNCFFALCVLANSAGIPGCLCVQSDSARAHGDEIRNACVLTYPRDTA